MQETVPSSATNKQRLKTYLFRNSFSHTLLEDSRMLLNRLLVAEIDGTSAKSTCEKIFSSTSVGRALNLIAAIFTVDRSDHS